MRLLLIHAERFSFRARERAVEDADVDKLDSYSSENVLVVFTTVEEEDVDDERYLTVIAKDVLDVCSRVHASSIVLYPYAHLSSRLAPPRQARAVISSMYRVLSKISNVNVIKAPFGYYKEFLIKCYGHPLSELSRSYSPRDVLRAAERPAERAQERTDYYVILTPEGDVVKVEDYRFRENELELKALVDKEVFRREVSTSERPRYLDYCKKFGIEWEPLSDIGHMRYGPEATIMFELISEYSWRVVRSLGLPVFKVRGTNMFRLSSRAVDEHARLFGERLYTVRSEDDVLVLRYAACFQQFSMVSDWIISYRDLPFGVFEVADSYRFERPGETVLCFRARKFHMPDLHVFTRDVEEAKKIGLLIHDKIFEEARKVGRDYVSLYNVTEDFLMSHKDYLVELARREGRSVLLRVFRDHRYYWVMNAEYHIVDELGRPREIATLQFDVGNAERFNIRYQDERGETRYPVIIHTAIIGSVERYMYMLLDKAALDERQGRTPRLPTWICPIQVRLIPISRDYVSYAESLADKIEAHDIRVDVDDRDETVSRKIMEAEKSWIPYIVVIGRREVESSKLSVRIRGVGMKTLGSDELISLIEDEIKGYPKAKLSMPRELSRRPVYKAIV